MGELFGSRAALTGSETAGGAFRGRHCVACVLLFFQGEIAFHKLYQHQGKKRLRKETLKETLNIELSFLEISLFTANY